MVMDKIEEFKNLQNIGKIANYNHGINGIMIKYTAEIFKKYIPSYKSSILELGPAEGTMTDILADIYNDYTIVEAVSEFCEVIKKNHKHIKVNNCLFENFNSSRKYDVIVLGHVLEHVENPIELLKKVKTWTKPNGLILAAVPNSNSIHRQAAVLMGLLKEQNELGETDKLIGHRRVYNIEQLKSDFDKSKLSVYKYGGYFLKPLTNKQIEEQFSCEMVDAFMQLGEKYPEIAAEIYVIGKNIM